MRKRLLSVLLALCMLLSLCPMAAFAAEGEPEEIIWVEHEGIGSIEDSLPLPSTFGITSSTYSEKYYNQLDKNSQDVYDAIYGDGSPLKAGPVKYDKDNATTTSVSLNVSCSGKTDANDIISAALAALLYDHPELSWLVNTQWSYGGTASTQGGEITTITRISLSDIGYKEATTDPENVGTPDNGYTIYNYANTKDLSALTEKINAVSITGSNKYEKAKAIHDWVCNNMKYTDTTSAKFTNSWRGFQTAYSALVQGDTVCAGYAKSFKLLCDKFGVPCAIVTGTGNGGPHAWNYVQMDDNKWYGVDCTWDDNEGSTPIEYTYFLKGSQSFISESGTGNTHKEGTLYSTYAFDYPDLATADYNPSTTTPEKPELAGTVTISKSSSSGSTPRIGDTLTATANITSNNPGDLTYKWYRDSEAISGATQTTYVPVVADFGKTIKVEVSAANCSGSVTSDPTEKVAKKYGPAVTGGLSATITSNSLKMKEQAGVNLTAAEFAISTTAYQYPEEETFTWQDSTTFDNLQPDTDYYVYSRYKETDDAEPSSISRSGPFHTAKADAGTDLEKRLKDSAVPYNGTYDGSEHDAFNLTSLDGWSVTYADAEDGTYNSAMPKVTNVSDSKTLWVKFSCDGYNDVVTSYEVKVTPKSITGATITLGTAPTYNGTEQTITVSKVAVDGQDLTATDYAVTGDKATNVENTTLTVTGKDNYTGTATKTWTLQKATPTAADFDLPTATDLTKDYTGSPISVTVTPKTGKAGLGAATVKYDGSTTAPTAAGTYAVTFDVADSTNYKATTGLSAGTLTINEVKYKVEIKTSATGSGMTLAAGSGSATQTDLIGQMTDVIYQADADHYFPENYSVTGSSGISVKRDSESRITISGTPTANVTLTLTDATAKTQETTPSAAFVADGPDSGALTGMASGMKYSLDGGSTWIDIADATVSITSGVDVAKGIQVIKPATDFTKKDSEVQTIAVTKPNAPNGLNATSPTVAGNDGKITGTTAAMEYSTTSAFTDAANCTDTETTGLAAGTYYVRVKANGTALASDYVAVNIVTEGTTAISGTVAITGTEKFGEQLTAAVTGGPEEGTLTYKWMRGSTEIGTGSTYTLTANDVGLTITVVVTHDTAVGELTATTGVIAKADAPAAPSGLTGVAPTTAGGSDGRITGTDNTMEYSTTSAFTSATDCIGSETTGLTAGTYYVRVKGTAGTNPGVAATVTVPAYTSEGAPVISLNVTGTHNFPAAAVGYGAQTAKTVTVKNTGNAGTGTLTVVLSGTNATSFELSKASIADIAASGSDTFTVVPKTALEVGSYTATVTVDGDSVEAQTFNVSFTVTAAEPETVAVTGVTLNKTSTSLTVGSSETLTATVAPANATNKNVSWTSSNTDVATVDASGKVTAVAAGNATITVTTEDGGKTAECAVTVTAATTPDPGPDTPHEHTYATAWTSDASGHWHVCSGCTERGSFAAHTPGDWIVDTAATSTTEGSRHKECTVCGYHTETESIPATGGSSSGGSSSGGTSSGGGNTTTETTKNPDGSTTTKTENKTTGTVTETTKNPDGSTTKVETKKDGTVTTTETDATGNKTETVAKPDGSSVTKVEQKDGTQATVNTDTEGKVEAEVTLPEQVVAAAQENEQPVMLPIPVVQATASTETAPVVTVKTGSDEPVKVLIPTTEAKPGTVAVIVNEDGTEEIVKTSVSTGDGLAVSLPDGATVKIVDNSKTFADVPANNWAADAVSFSSARELFSGTSESTFSPNEPMTRAMMVTVLARFDGADTSGGSTWYEQGVEWAVAKGISDGSNPGSNISREQLAVMLWRYAGSPAPTGDLEGFHDAGAVSGYAQEAMRWAVENGIINGNGSGGLMPQGEATRAQVAQMLKNFISMQ